MFCEFLESVKLFPNHWSAKDTFRCVRWQRALELVHLFLQGTAWQVLFFFFWTRRDCENLGETQGTLMNDDDMLED